MSIKSLTNAFEKLAVDMSPKSYSGKPFDNIELNNRIRIACEQVCDSDPISALRKLGYPSSQLLALEDHLYKCVNHWSERRTDFLN